MNLIKQALEPDHISSVQTLKRNVEFARQLVSDLRETFHVGSYEERPHDDTYRMTVGDGIADWRARQRSSSNLEIKVTTETITLTVTLRYSLLEEFVGVEEYKYRAQNPDMPYETARINFPLLVEQAAKKQHDAKTYHIKDGACGDRYQFTIAMTQDDPKLPAKLQSIVKAMRLNGVKLRFDSV
jgi:hypothetical protein